VQWRDLLRQRLFVRVAHRAFAPVEAQILNSLAMQGSPGGHASPGVPPAIPATVAMRDLDALRHLVASPLGPAAADLPFAGVFLVALFVLHPTLGWLGLAGALALVGVAVAGRRLAHPHAEAEQQATAAADALADALSATAGPRRGLADDPGLAARWNQARATADVGARRAAETQGTALALARGVRHGLQAAILAVAAALVLVGDLTPGAIVAAMVMAGRALAPVDALSAQAAALARARAAIRRLGQLVLDPDTTGAGTGTVWTDPVDMPAGDGVMQPPAGPLAGPAGLHVRALCLGHGHVDATRGAAGAGRAISFDLAPGQALGVIGPSGSGKSAFLRLLAGAFTPCSGHVWLGPATGAGPLAGGVVRTGFLPQPTVLPPGTLAQVVAWSDPAPDPARLRSALEASGALDQVLSLPRGSDTPIGPGHPPLPAGLIQRLAITRAIYGDPAIVVLDTPEAGLDSDALAALADLTRSQRNRGAIVVIATHTPRLIAGCDLLLALAAGGPILGPRETVLRQVVANHAEIALAGMSPSGHRPNGVPQHERRDAA